VHADGSRLRSGERRHGHLPANPNIPSERPNILIILDNTANWNTPFVNEKFCTGVGHHSLTDNYNVA